MFNLLQLLVVILITDFSSISFFIHYREAQEFDLMIEHSVQKRLQSLGPGGL